MTTDFATAPNDRRNIYYWKCDRPHAFHGTAQTGDRQAREQAVLPALHTLLARDFGGVPADLRSTHAQGNHLIFRASVRELDCIVRVEDGPECDDYMEVEAEAIRRVIACGVPSWNVLGVDSSRREAPFAWQIIERVPGADLNHWLREGTLDLNASAFKIGQLVARWQGAPVGGFGPFQPLLLREKGALRGFHARYDDYFYTRWQDHLDFLQSRGFLSATQTGDIDALVRRQPALDLPDAEGPVLVHKDLALWNVVGNPPSEIGAVIDWDDTVGGDPADDISLLACFHDAQAVQSAWDGYASVKPLPARWLERFWLHLLRNMIWKSVIRVGSGYFDIADGKNFFLTGGKKQNGGDLKTFTLARIETALRGLREGAGLEIL